MADTRQLGSVQRAAIYAALEQFHDEHAAWPSRGQLAALTGLTLRNLRYHLDQMVTDGDAQRAPGGTIQLVRRGDASGLPPVITELEALVLSAVAECIAKGAPSCRVVDILTILARRQAGPISRVCMRMARQGRLIRHGNGGYSLPTVTP